MCSSICLRIVVVAVVVLCCLIIVLAQLDYGDDVHAKGTYASDDQEPLYLFEGDIIGYRPIRGALYSGVTKPENIWPGGVVPYEISPKYSASEKRIILVALGSFAQQTCITFRPKNSEDQHSIYIAPMQSGTCFTFWGRQTHAELAEINRQNRLLMGKKQLVNIARDGCVEHGTILHELMHAVGFLHEQSRHDRDDYVEILLQNIRLSDHDQFEKHTDSDPQGTSYDFGSIMHYTKDAFTKNGQDTIRPRPLYRGKTFGQRDGLSPIDIQKINRLYSRQCRGSSPAPGSTPRPEPGNGSGQVVRYVVKSGDILSRIALQRGKNWQTIAKDNGLTNPDYIYPGQVIIIK